MSGGDVFLRMSAPLVCAVVSTLVFNRFMRLAGGASMGDQVNQLLDDPVGAFGQSFERMKLLGQRQTDPRTERWRLLAIAVLVLTALVIAATLLLPAFR